MSIDKIIKVHALDKVAVALSDISRGDRLRIDDNSLAVLSDIPAGHKIALQDIESGATVTKYGASIGIATRRIHQGEHVHTHNLATALSGLGTYTYSPVPVGRETHIAPSGRLNGAVFQGYRRGNRLVGTRNEIWILSTVGCVSRTVEKIATAAAQRYAGAVDGIHAINHPFGCSQLGDDLQYTRQVLAGLMANPNAGGVLLVGLGCESNQLADLLALVGNIDQARTRYFNAQEVDDEVGTGVDEVGELVEIAREDRRTECSLEDLTIGLKCGGSDGFSGLSANPLLGRICGAITDANGRAILSEIPEMFGSEQQLLDRCASEGVFGRLVDLINDFKQYFIDHGQPIYENPSPGNIEGGITTLEEKSLGATQKGGRAMVTDILRYGEVVKQNGLSILEAPGNDGVSSTAMVASGATILLFTTGRGTPLGFPAPTLKVSSNSAIATRKPNWIDFDAGVMLGAQRKDDVAEGLMTKILQVASGEPTCNERNGEREIAIWKRGVTL